MLTGFKQDPPTSLNENCITDIAPGYTDLSFCTMINSQTIQYFHKFKDLKAILSCMKGSFHAFGKPNTQ